MPTLTARGALASLIAPSHLHLRGQHPFVVRFAGIPGTLVAAAAAAPWATEEREAATGTH